MRIHLTADGVYDRTQPWWNNANDRVMWERSFNEGPRQQTLESSALMLSDPLTRNRFIRQQMTANPEVPLYGAMKMTPTIDDVLAGNFSSGTLNDRAPTDFSGTTAGVESSSIPSLPYWS